MARHPLLPRDYSDPMLQSAILNALMPYKTSERGDINNPMLQWNLAKAWKDAEALLAHGGWKYTNDGGDSSDEYERIASSDEEIERLHVIIAGIVAHQLLEEDSQLAIRRVEYRKGGAVRLSIGPKAAAALRAMFPKAQFDGDGETKGSYFLSLQKLLQKMLGFFR